MGIVKIALELVEALEESVSFKVFLDDEHIAWATVYEDPDEACGEGCAVHMLKRPDDEALRDAIISLAEWAVTRMEIDIVEDEED